LNSYQEVIMMTYEAALAYLESLATFGSQLGLARIEKLLDLMGNPQNCYKTLHVTGTNGKGSTAAMLTAILTTAGISTALYTSPHLAR
jgi:dihydrofolate synthase/folylpolyglutamate synthase